VSRISTLVAVHDSWKTIFRFRPSHGGHGTRCPGTGSFGLRATAPLLLTHDFASRHIRLSFQRSHGWRKNRASPESYDHSRSRTSPPSPRLGAGR